MAQKQRTLRQRSSSEAKYRPISAADFPNCFFGCDSSDEDSGSASPFTVFCTDEDKFNDACGVCCEKYTVESSSQDRYPMTQSCCGQMLCRKCDENKMIEFCPHCRRPNNERQPGVPNIGTANLIAAIRELLQNKRRKKRSTMQRAREAVGWKDTVEDIVDKTQDAMNSSINSLSRLINKANLLVQVSRQTNPSPQAKEGLKRIEDLKDHISSFKDLVEILRGFVCSEHYAAILLVQASKDASDARQSKHAATVVMDMVLGIAEAVKKYEKRYKQASSDYDKGCWSNLEKDLKGFAQWKWSDVLLASLPYAAATGTAVGSAIVGTEALFHVCLPILGCGWIPFVGIAVGVAAAVTLLVMGGWALIKWLTSGKKTEENPEEEIEKTRKHIEEALKKGQNTPPTEEQVRAWLTQIRASAATQPQQESLPRAVQPASSARVGLVLTL